MFKTLISVDFLIPLFLTFALSNQSKPKNRALEFLDGFQLVRREDWNTLVSCPLGLYITGLRLREALQEVQESNKSCVVGFEIICSDGIFPSNNTRVVANLARAMAGEWKKPKICKSGFVVAISTTLSTLGSGSMILSLRIHCSGDLETEDMRKNEASYRYHEQLAMTQASQKYFQICDEGDGFVGINIRADSIITFYKGDRASIKEIGVDCRRVENPSVSCTIAFGWEKRQNLNCSEPFQASNNKSENISTNSTWTKNCTFETYVGLGQNEKIHNVDKAIKSYESVGRDNDQEFVKWMITKRLLSPNITKWFNNKFPETPNLLNEFVTDELSKLKTNYTGSSSFVYEDPPPTLNHIFSKITNQMEFKNELIVEQLVGRCSIYKIVFNLFKQKHYMYFETPIKKRMTRIVFDLLA